MITLKLQQEDRKLLLDHSKWKALGLDPNRGLLIMGPVGVGKTDLMTEYLRDKNRGHWLEPSNIRRGIQTHGVSYLDQFSQDHFTFDDLGKEPEMINIWGTIFFPGQEIIDLRYSVFKRTSGKNRTCFTTNLNKENLEKAYGERCFSRLVEMCNFVTIDGQDLRKKL